MAELIIFKTSRVWNPMTIMVDGKGYALNNILFYNKNGVVTQTNKGWFDDYDKDRVILSTKKDIKRCTKLNLTKGIPFIINSDCNYETRYELYIPYDDFDWDITYTKKYDQIFEIYHMKNTELEMQKSVKSFFSMTSSIREEYDDILENLKFFAGQPPKTFMELHEKLKKIYNSYIQTRQFVDDYTVEDYLDEIRKDEE